MSLDALLSEFGWSLNWQSLSIVVMQGR